jgi:hypothetical protein
LDAYQFVRAQSFISERFGKQFLPSREYAEIDITYKCNLKCINCNRSCSQAPSNLEISVADVEAFICQSVENKITWKRIRILGGEPTLHSCIFDITNLLIDYQRNFNPSVRLIKECGLGLTPSGYYICAVAGGIDRIYRYNLGRKKIPDESDSFSDQMSAFCRLCGHFGFQWPTRKSRQSKTWRVAYGRFDRKKIGTG